MSGLKTCISSVTQSGIGIQLWWPSWVPWTFFVYSVYNSTHFFGIHENGKLKSPSDGAGEEESIAPLSTLSLTITQHGNFYTKPSVDVDVAKKSIHASLKKNYSASNSQGAEIPSSLKNSSQCQGTGFSKQVILFLAKAFICAGTIPIIGTSQKEYQYFSRLANYTNNRL